MTNSYKLKSLEIIQSKARIDKEYIDVSFLTQSWVGTKSKFLVAIETDFECAYTELLQDPISKEFKLDEYLFELSKDFSGLFYSTETKVSPTGKIKSRMILNNGNTRLSSADLLDMYQSSCLFAKIGFPKTVSIDTVTERTDSASDTLLLLQHLDK